VEGPRLAILMRSERKSSNSKYLTTSSQLASLPSAPILKPKCSSGEGMFLWAVRGVVIATISIAERMR